MPKRKRSPKPETRQERWKRENLTLAIEEITGVPREEWENCKSRNRSVLRIRRMYVYLMNTLLKYSQWDIVDIFNGEMSQGYICKSIKMVREWVSENSSEPENKAEIEAITKNYETRPAYNFDTIA